MLKNVNFRLFLVGFSSILAAPPINLFCVLFFAIPYFFHNVYKAKTPKNAAKIALFFGFGYYIANTHWTSFSLFQDLRFVILFPISLTITALYFSLFLILTTYIYKLIEGKISNNLMKIFAFAILWVLHERLRSSIGFQFPWWTIGMTLSSVDAWVQPLSIIGIGLFGFCTISLYLSPIVARIECQKWQKFLALLFIFATHATFLIFGQIRFDQASQTKDERDFNIIMVQTNFTQYQKFQEAQNAMDFYQENTIKALKEAQKNDKKTIIIWPETSIPYAISKNEINRDEFINYIKRYMKEDDVFVFGGIKKTETGYTNSMFMLTKDNKISIYDKVNIVPFGEYVPLLSGKFDFLPNIERGKNERQSWEIFDKTFVPLICYEVLFDQKVKKLHPDYIINISNDGWFGSTIGPYQHFAHAKILAIKNGATVIRVANTGKSAVIDKYGRVLSEISRKEEKFLIA